MFKCARAWRWHAMVAVGAITGASNGNPFFSLGRFDEDADLDIVACHQADNAVQVWATVSNRRVALITQFVVPGPVAAAVADLDDNGFGDLILLADGGLSVHVYLQLDNGLQLANIVALPFAADGIFLAAACGGPTQVFLGLSETENCSVISDPLADAGAVVLTDDWTCPEASAPSCDVKYDTSDEGECSTTPLGPGVQSCIDAAWCRSNDCHWAACILKESGEWSWVRWAAGNLACGMVTDVEIAACFPSEILPLP